MWRLQLRAAGGLGGGEAACTTGNLWQMRGGEAGGALRVSAVRVRGRRGREREEVAARMDSRMHPELISSVNAGLWRSRETLV